MLCKLVEFSKIVRSFQLVVVVILCSVNFLCSFVSKLMCSLVVSDLSDWMYWLCVVCVSRCCVCVLCFLQYLEFGFSPYNKRVCRSFGSCFTCTGTVTTSFVGRKSNFRIFGTFCGCFMICLNFNFYSSYDLLLELE